MLDYEEELLAERSVFDDFDGVSDALDELSLCDDLDDDEYDDAQEL